jgi:hypothetical protein
MAVLSRFVNEVRAVGVGLCLWRPTALRHRGHTSVELHFGPLTEPHCHALQVVLTSCPRPVLLRVRVREIGELALHLISRLVVGL